MPTSKTNPSRSVPPDFEIAWARAISRAVDQPAFAERLKADPAAALAELGVSIPDGIDVRSDVSPTLEEALPAIERHRAAVAQATPGSVAAWPPLTFAAGTLASGGCLASFGTCASFSCFFASANPSTVGTSVSTIHCHSGQTPARAAAPYASRPVGAYGSAGSLAPQWWGTSPSGATASGASASALW